MQRHTCLFLALSFCHRSPATSTPKPEPLLRATMPFCAYGGTGVIGANMDPDDYYSVLAWLTLDAPQGATGLQALRVEITGAGKVESTLRKIETVEVLAPDAKLAAPDVWGLRGTPFTGTLPAGQTKLRVHAWITKRPKTPPFELRIDLGQGATATCALGVEWPTG